MVEHSTFDREIKGSSLASYWNKLDKLEKIKQIKQIRKNWYADK